MVAGSVPDVRDLQEHHHAVAAPVMDQPFGLIPGAQSRNGSSPLTQAVISSLQEFDELGNATGGERGSCIHGYFVVRHPGPRRAGARPTPAPVPAALPPPTRKDLRSRPGKPPAQSGQWLSLSRLDVLDFRTRYWVCSKSTRPPRVAILSLGGRRALTRGPRGGGSRSAG